jgi:hypothetical protein
LGAVKLTPEEHLLVRQGEASLMSKLAVSDLRVVSKLPVGFNPVFLV